MVMGIREEMNYRWVPRRTRGPVIMSSTPSFLSRAGQGRSDVGVSGTGVSLADFVAGSSPLKSLTRVYTSASIPVHGVFLNLALESARELQPTHIPGLHPTQSTDNSGGGTQEAPVCFSLIFKLFILK